MQPYALPGGGQKRDGTGQLSSPENAPPEVARIDAVSGLPRQRAAREMLKDPRAQATLVPSTARMLLGLADERGLSVERLCRGLGLSPHDLAHEDILISHQQTRALILRTQRLLGEPALGLAVGARETPVSWGLAGLAMLTCETLGEAVTYGLERQAHTGSMLHLHLTQAGQQLHMTASSRLFDLEIEPFLVEEAFAGAVAVVRAMVGASFRPTQVDFTFKSSGNSHFYERFFRCPVRFEADEHRLITEAQWMAVRLPGHDRLTSHLLRKQLNQLLTVPIGHDALLESVTNRIRFGVQDQPSQKHLAQQVNVSDRTLRRQLEARDTNYRALRDEARLDRARDLLANTGLTISEVALALGYSDARSFRRAFKRWTGQLPTAMRTG